LTEERTPLILSPSAAAGLAHGFATVSRFFSGARDVLASIDDDIQFALLGPGTQGKARCFEDQYLSTGGQLYELMMGHDRFLADLRPLLRPVFQQRGWMPGLRCHPYDLCTELVAREAGVLITDENGQQLRCPTNLETHVSGVGYANQQIRHWLSPSCKQRFSDTGSTRRAQNRVRNSELLSCR